MAEPRSRDWSGIRRRGACASTWPLAPRLKLAQRSRSRSAHDEEQRAFFDQICAGAFGLVLLFTHTNGLRATVKRRKERHWACLFEVMVFAWRRRKRRKAAFCADSRLAPSPLFSSFGAVAFSSPSSIPAATPAAARDVALLTL